MIYEWVEIFCGFNGLLYGIGNLVVIVNLVCKWL